ncbi:TPA: hypothetical protein ACQSRC_004429 [Pseudomonas aeruginosa]|uniref:hypothetical protein n=1 Tax=Pseudomonas aeruginosa TaxID=287 RepID=UPI000BB942BE|nr:hypothetical protein [Pseudomonas aeruginosa]MED5069276.1 hypothetical protein [Pseudomonas aeruginosa]MWB71494.1 hypothetical protein [Pseudomonas aeruginosa]PBV86444.1 hypothetical protein CJU22_23245 [Pseudomonas aeruginosa]RRH85257.1 hypothetical protein EIM22_02865 [Pseudomonas aeruginosa]
MSSTQHQLIEQCATRLRGIVEALDNIHDNTPHRWSTELDDVHSSAESLLALIKDQAPTQAAQGLAGAALAQPSPVPEPFELRLCEQRHTVLQPDRTYLFTVDPNCATCMAMAAGERQPAEQAEAERPEVVAWSNWKEGTSSHVPFRPLEEAEGSVEASEIAATQGGPYKVKRLMTIDQHDRIVGALRADRDSWAEQAEAGRPEVVGYRIMRAQADKIYQRVDKAAAEYEAGRSALGYMEDIAETALCLRNRLDDLLAAAPAQAQHSVPGIAESVSECMALAQTVFARMEGLMPRGKKLPEKHVARRLLAELETLAKLAAAPAPGGE